MKKNSKNQIPATYWNTTMGGTLHSRMHGDGQEAIDMILSVEEGLEIAIETEIDEAVKAELEKAKKQIHASLLAFRRGFYGLSNEGF